MMAVVCGCFELWFLSRETGNVHAAPGFWPICVSGITVVPTEKNEAGHVLKPAYKDVRDTRDIDLRWVRVRCYALSGIEMAPQLGYDQCIDISTSTDFAAIIFKSNLSRAVADLPAAIGGIRVFSFAD